MILKVKSTSLSNALCAVKYFRSRRFFRLFRSMGHRRRFSWWLLNAFAVYSRGMTLSFPEKRVTLHERKREAAGFPPSFAHKWKWKRRGEKHAVLLARVFGHAPNSSLGNYPSGWTWRCDRGRRTAAVPTFLKKNFHIDAPTRGTNPGRNFIRGKSA